MMAHSVASKEAASNSVGRGINKDIRQKLWDNAMSKTEFYDISRQSQLLPALNIDSTVHPQLEAVEFYKGEQISDDNIIPGLDWMSGLTERKNRPALDEDYIPQSTKFYHRQMHERKSGYRNVITLDDIMENFKEGQISFVGQAGSGKTTLLKAITQQVIEGKYKNLSNIEVVHFVNLRTFKRSDSVTAAELLFGNVTPKMTDIEMKEAMQYSKENPEKVLFVIDSLDTVPYTIDGVYTGITTEDRASPEAILFHLLSDVLIPGCRFITSSREYAIRNYKGDVQAKQVIALAGLTKESMRRIVVGYVGEQEAELKMNYLKRKPVIELLCATPVWLIFTLMVLSVKSKYTPTTMASILVILLQNMTRSEHVHERNIEVVVGKLGKMAFTGTKQHRVEFSLNELGNFNLCESEIRDLMVATPSGGYQKLILGDSVLIYAHQCLQEILSAFHIAKMNLMDFKEFISEYIHEPHYAVVRRLLAGILMNNKVSEEAENFLEDAEDLEKKKFYLRENLKEQLKTHETKYLSDEDLLEFYMCLSEIGDGANDIIQNEVDEFDFSSMTLSSSEMHCIGWIMSQQTLVKKLKLFECNLTQASLSALYYSLEGSNVQLDELDVTGNTFGPDEMKVIAQICKQRKVDRFLVIGCNFLSGALKSFLVHSVGAKLDQLNVAGHTFGPDEMKVIAQICKQRKVDRFLVQYCNFLSGALKSFLVHSVGAKLDELDVAENTFGPDEMKVIAQICKQRKVDRLIVGECKFLSGALKSFLVHSVGAKISMLDVSGVKLEGHDRTLLGRIIKQCGVETLSTRKSEDYDSIDVEAFKISSDNIMIGKLQHTRFYDNFRVDAICKFLPYVAKEVILTGFSIDRDDLEILQNQLDVGRNKDLKIIIRENPIREKEELEHKVLESRKPTAANSPSIVEDRRAELNSDGSITVSWHYPDENPDVRYHVETFRNDQPTGDMEICKEPYYECKTSRPSLVYCFRIWAVDSNGLTGIAMFTNEVMRRGLVISESLHKEVGLDGGHMTVGNCSALFPKNSFSILSPVALTSEIDSSKWPRNFTGLTPTLYVNAQGLREKVGIRLPSWGIINEQNMKKIRILHLPTGSNEWEDTDIDLSFTDNSFLEFEWHDFSPILGGFWPFRSNDKALEYKVSTSVFASDFGEVCIAHHVENDLVLKAMLNVMKSKHFKLKIKSFPAKEEEEIETVIKCVDQGFVIEPSGPFFYTVDADLGKEHAAHHIAIKSNSQEEERIVLTGEIKKNEELVQTGKFGFAHMWKPTKKKAIKRKIDESSLPSTSGNININVRGHKFDKRRYHDERVMAQNYANHGSEIASAQTGTTVRMSEQIEARQGLEIDQTETDDENQSSESEA